jgi:Flp pilus assembly protein TadD
VLASEGQTGEALTELQRAVSLRPQYWRNQQSLGVFYLRTRKLPEAVDALTRLTELNPEDANPYQQLGAAYQMLGDNVRARQNYERSLAVRPNPDSYANIGTIQYSEGRFAEAAEAYEQAIRLTPNRALYHRNLGDAYLKLGRRGDAHAAYGQAVRFAEARLTVNPNDATTMSQLGVYEAKVGKRREAERHSSAAVVINPASPEILYRRAVVLALNGDRDKALNQLSEAIAKGYSKGLAIADDDLAALRSLPAFRSLVSPAQ